MAAKTLRNLTNGAGTVTVYASSNYVVFSQVQDLKPGCTIKTNGGQLITIKDGAGQNYVSDQIMTTNETGVSFLMSDQSTSRARGASGLIVPNADHFVYQSNTDDAGNVDLFVFVDTLAPENGVHPYTKDKMISSFRSALSAAQQIPDLNLRVRRLEGVLRAGRSVSSMSQDLRLADVINRIYQMERYLNGQIGVPAVGTGASYGENDFLLYGDQT